MILPAYPRRCVWFGSAAMLATCCIVGTAFGAVTFTGLGNTNFGATGVSADGSVVAGGLPPFRWTAATGPVGLGALPGTSLALGTALSADGSTVVGWSADANAAKAFRWTAATGMTDLGSPAGSSLSEAHGVSGDGSVVVGNSQYSGGAVAEEAMRWTGLGGPESLGFLPGGHYSTATAISADGSTIVGAAETAAGNRTAVRWTQTQGLVDLGGSLDGVDSRFAQGVSADGRFVVGATLYQHTKSSAAFLWSAGKGLVELGRLDGADTSSQAVTADGSTVVGLAGGGGFVWTAATGMLDFQDVLEHRFGLEHQLADWGFLEPFATSPDGRYIAGRGSHNTSEAWLLDRGADLASWGPSVSSVPEASAFGAWASGLALALLVVRARARHLRALALLRSQRVI